MGQIQVGQHHTLRVKQQATGDGISNWQTLLILKGDTEKGFMDTYNFLNLDGEEDDRDDDEEE